MKLKNITTFMAGATLPLLSGCGIIRGTFIAVAAAVGLAGYVVYETGDAVVSGTKAVASGTTKAVSKVVFFNGNFKTEHPYGIRFVAMGTTTALRNAGFRDIRHSSDALSGEISARTREGTEVKITFKNVEPSLTSVVIRIGNTGNLDQSEKINNMIAHELKLMHTTANVKTGSYNCSVGS